MKPAGECKSPGKHAPAARLRYGKADMSMRSLYVDSPPLESAMTERTPGSASLKLSRTSVMLYENGYERLADGRAASTQRYLGSFPRSATAIPAKFDALLREATRWRPGRYQALLERIHREVLGPARLRKAEEQSAARRAAVEAALDYALDAVSGIQPGEIDAALAATVAALLAQARRLQPGPPAADSEDELPVF